MLKKKNLKNVTLTRATRLTRASTCQLKILEPLESRNLFAWTGGWIEGYTEEDIGDNGSWGGVSASASPEVHTNMTPSQNKTTINASLPAHTQVSITVYIHGSNQAGGEEDVDTATFEAGGESVTGEMSSHGMWEWETLGTLVFDHDSSTLEATMTFDGIEEGDRYHVCKIYLSIWTPVVSISGGGATTEDGAPLTFNIARDGDAATWTQPLTVNLDKSGSAVSDTDYSGFQNTVTIPANSQSTTFNLTPINDPKAEGVEDIYISLKSGNNYKLAADPATPPATNAATAKGTIDDDVSVSSINVSVLTTQLKDAGLSNNVWAAPIKTNSEFDFFVLITIEGEKVDQVKIKQMVKSSTTLQDAQTGVAKTSQEMMQIFELQGNPNLFNLIQTAGDDYQTDDNWNWVGPEIITADKSKGYIADRQSLQIPKPVAGSDASLLATTTRNFRIEAKKGGVGPTLKEKTWNYTWTNTHLKWIVNPPVPFCTDPTKGDSKFTGSGIDGLF